MTVETKLMTADELLAMADDASRKYELVDGLSDTYGEVDRKVNAYLAAGTRRVIVVNPCNKTATITTPGGHQVITIDDSLSGADVVPGWSLAMRELFA